MGPAQSRSEATVSDSQVITEVSSGQDGRCSTRIRDGIIESIHKLWQSREYADLTVVVHGVEVKCHSFILFACSSYFSRLLQSGSQQGLDRKVTIDSFSEQTFETILEALYSGKDVVNSDNIINVWYASYQLEIAFMIEECEEFVLEHLTVQNVGHLHKHALFVKSEKVLKATTDMMLKHFEVFKECPTFVELSFDDLLKLVESHDLEVSSEDAVVDAVLKWAVHDLQAGEGVTIVNRRSFLGRLLFTSRLSLVSPECIARLVSCRELEDDDEVKKILSSAVLYQISVDQRHGQWPSSAFHRKCSRFENVAIAGFTDGLVSTMSLLDLNWHDWKPVSYFNDCYVSMAVFDNTLYAFSSKRSECVIHTGRQHRERPASDLQNSANSMINTYGQLYTLNNSAWQFVVNVPGTEQILVSHLNSIYFIHPITRKLQILDRPFENTMLTVLDDVPSDGIVVSAVPFETNILVFCQAALNVTQDSTVHCFDTKGRKWTRLSNLRGPAQLISLRNDRNIYILQSNGTVSQIVSTHGNRVSFRYIEKLWNFQWHLYGSVILGRKLLICGSELNAYSGMNVDQEQKPSLTGVFDSIDYVYGEFNFFQPVILSKNILHQL